MTSWFWPLLNSIIILLLAYSCQSDQGVSEGVPAVKADVPCNYIHDVAAYVDCIYRMNPDTHSITIELGEGAIPDLTRFTSLTDLWIIGPCEGCFATFSPEVLKLKDLKNLIVSKSVLSLIPEEISKLENLETLTVGGRWRLKRLPENLRQLKKLRVLDVWRNDLNGDSLDFTGMDALELVVIGENERVDLKRLKAKWPKLKVVDYNIQD